MSNQTSAKNSVIELVEKAVQERHIQMFLRMSQHSKPNCNHLKNLMEDQEKNMCVNLAIYQKLLLKKAVIKIASELESYEIDMVIKQMWKALINQLNRQLNKLLLEEKIILQISKLTGDMIKTLIDKMINEFISEINIQPNNQYI
ncbi:hypothetical protein HELRODRAFT_179259 [Helobdella robusta]|uniref:Uncharacterized protein n=1 Tax=Helobdella robusta TaxID=6412 RepID=T1FEG1_HELRO|nr:hypothetical protein HELRODRAFT_179259 [Helobdella robusta]ESN95489.1 hypothetical protein HELRODRAFT_179259 [Helobdella robusta]